MALRESVKEQNYHIIQGPWSQSILHYKRLHHATHSELCTQQILIGKNWLATLTWADDKITVPITANPLSQAVQKLHLQ